MEKIKFAWFVKNQATIGRIVLLCLFLWVLLDHDVLSNFAKGIPFLLLAWLGVMAWSKVFPRLHHTPKLH
jgi:hypothetical protein